MTPVSNLFFITRKVYFLHQVNLITALSQLLFNTGSERKQCQCGSCCVHCNRRATVEMDFVPTVRDNIASVHV